MTRLVRTVTVKEHWYRCTIIGEKKLRCAKSLGAISYFESILKAYDRGTGK